MEELMPTSRPLEHVPLLVEDDSGSLPGTHSPDDRDAHHAALRLIDDACPVHPDLRKRLVGALLLCPAVPGVQAAAEELVRWPMPDPSAPAGVDAIRPT